MPGLDSEHEIGSNGLDIRRDITVTELRKKARTKTDGRVAARLLGIAAILDGMDRESAARLAGMTRQTLRGNISLLPLPRYSLELNPQQNIWQFLRHNYLANRIFETYEDILDACCHAWQALINEAGRIQSIADREWAQVRS